MNKPICSKVTDTIKDNFANGNFIDPTANINIGMVHSNVYNRIEANVKTNVQSRIRFTVQHLQPSQEQVNKVLDLI